MVARWFADKARELYGDTDNIFADGGVGKSFAFDLATALYYRAITWKYKEGYKEVASSLLKRLAKDCNFRPGLGAKCHSEDIRRAQRKERDGRYNGDDENALRIMREMVKTPKDAAKVYFDLLHFLDECDSKKERRLYRSIDDPLGGITLFAPDGEDIYLQGDDAFTFSEEENRVLEWTNKELLLSPFRDTEEVLSYTISMYFQ